MGRGGGGMAKKTVLNTMSLVSAYSQNSSPSGLGFLLPANQILPAAEETTDSVVTMLTAILDKW